MHKRLSLAITLSLLSFASFAAAAPPKSAPESKNAKAAKKEPPAPAATTETTAASAPSPKDKDKEKDEAQASNADAEAKPEKRISVAAMVGLGFNETKIKTDNGQETQDGTGIYGVGFGLRGGYTLPMHVYVGGAFVYHAGSSNEAKQIKYEGNVLYVGPEVGYELAVGPATIRPYLGLGYGAAKAKASAGGGALSIDRSEGGIALWPGALATYPVIESVFVGVDARYAVITGTDKITNANGFGAFLTTGAAF